MQAKWKAIEKLAKQIELKEDEMELQNLEKALAQNPDDTDLLVSIGRIYFQMKNYEKSKAFFLQLLAHEPENPGINMETAFVFEWLGDDAQAAVFHTKAIEADPRHADYYHWRGCAYGRLGEYEKALHDFKQCGVLDPNNAKNHAETGFACTQLDEYTEAIDWYNKALALDDRIAYFFAYRGRNAVFMERYDEAVVDYDKAIAMYGDCAEWYEWRACAHRFLENYPQAVADYAQAMELDEDEDCYAKSRLQSLYGHLKALDLPMDGIPPIQAFPEIAQLPLLLLGEDFLEDVSHFVEPLLFPKYVDLRAWLKAELNVTLPQMRVQDHLKIPPSDAIFLVNGAIQWRRDDLVSMNIEQRAETVIEAIRRYYVQLDVGLSNIV